jgi:tetratricopeptide (TPR) repeat protein
MRALLRNVMVGAGIACASVALAAPKAAGPKSAAPTAPKGAAPKGAAPKGRTPAAPKVDPREQLKDAERHHQSGKYDEALAAIDAGLAVAPKDIPLLTLKGEVLLKTNDEPGALDTYKTLYKLLPEGFQKVTVGKTIANLTSKQTTFVEVTVTNGPAEVRFGRVVKGVKCQAAPSCKTTLAPGAHKVTVVRPGFEPWTGGVTVASGNTAQLTVTLTESSSRLAVRVAQPGASVTVDGAAYDPSAPVKPGKHEVVVSLDRHETARLEAVAGLGKPIELDVTLARLVPIRIVSPGAAIQPVPALQLDGKPVSIQDGTLRLQPGAHDLEVSAPGFQKRTIKIPAELGPDYQAVVALQPVVEPDRGPSLRRKVALAAGGLGLAALGTGVVLGLQSRGLADDTLALCDSPSTPCAGALEANDLNRRARQRASQANVAFGVAGGAVVAAAILWLTGAPESRSRVAITPHLGPQLGTTAGLDLSVRF